MSAAPRAQPAHGVALPPGRALMVLLALIILLAGYIALAYAFHVAAIFAGSAFLFFWLGIEKAAPAAFVATLVGAFGGIANASLLHPALAAVYGIDAGVAALSGLLVLAVAIYMLLIHRLTLLFNQSYMLFLTVAAIPSLGEAGMFVSMVEGVSLSAIYFGSVFWMLRQIVARRQLSAAAGAFAADQPSLD